jgi:hypothetical protein
MPLRSLRLTEAEAAAMRELTKRFAGGDLVAEAAKSAVRSRCAKLAAIAPKREMAVLSKGANRIDVLTRDEYLASRHLSLWDCD